MNTAGLFRSALEQRYQLIVASKEQQPDLRCEYFEALNLIADAGAVRMERVQLALANRIGRYARYRMEGFSKRRSFALSALDDIL